MKSLSLVCACGNETTPLNHPNSMNPIFKNITYFNHCRAMVGYCAPGASCRQNATGSITGLVEANFTARKPIALNFAW